MYLYGLFVLFCETFLPFRDTFVFIGAKCLVFAFSVINLDDLPSQREIFDVNSRTNTPEVGIIDSSATDDESSGKSSKRSFVAETPPWLLSKGART